METMITRYFFLGLGIVLLLSINVFIINQKGKPFMYLQSVGEVIAKVFIDNIFKKSPKLTKFIFG